MLLHISMLKQAGREGGKFKKKKKHSARPVASISDDKTGQTWPEWDLTTPLRPTAASLITGNTVPRWLSHQVVLPGPSLRQPIGWLTKDS